MNFLIFCLSKIKSQYFAYIYEQIRREVFLFVKKNRKISGRQKIVVPLKILKETPLNMLKKAIFYTILKKSKFLELKAQLQNYFFLVPRPFKCIKKFWAHENLKDETFKLTNQYKLFLA